MPAAVNTSSAAIVNFLMWISRLTLGKVQLRVMPDAEISGIRAEDTAWKAKATAALM
jgi:hypothetical protein